MRIVTLCTYAKIPRCGKQRGVQINSNEEAAREKIARGVKLRRCHFAVEGWRRRNMQERAERKTARTQEVNEVKTTLVKHRYSSFYFYFVDFIHTFIIIYRVFR